MPTAVHVSIWSSNSAERLHKCLSPGESVRIGRAPTVDWAIPWDPKISREHATIRADEDGIEIRCLEKAANGVTYRGQTVRKAIIGANEWFQIGQTIFQVSIKHEVPVAPEPVKYSPDDLEVFTHRSFSAGELRSTHIPNTDRQFEALEKLPGLISAAQSDDQLCEMLSDLLIEVIPKSVAVAVAHFDESKLPADDLQIEKFPKPLSMRVKTRDTFEGRFFPSRRMILECLKKQTSVLHIFSPTTESSFTITEGVGWAFCAPIKGESGRGWCLYVSGRGAPQGGLLVTQDVLMGDLRFTQLVAEFIGSIRQVRLLQEQKSQLTTFFSPKIMDGLTRANSKDALSPAERQISVLFCDVRGFSKKAESLRGDLMSLLKSASAALHVMATGIVNADGAVADFQGDAALGFWGWPMETDEGPIPACRSALAIYRAFQKESQQSDSLLAGFSIGMGIAHGRALAGQIGTNQHSKIGVFGPVVNQGSRLEGLTRQFGVPICVDENTANSILRFLPPTEGRLRRLARVRPNGMDTAITVYGLFPPVEEYPEVTEDIIFDHEFAVTAVIKGDWPLALEILDRIPDGDGPKRFLLEKIRQHDNCAPPDWDGAFTLTSK